MPTNGFYGFSSIPFVEKYKPKYSVYFNGSNALVATNLAIAQYSYTWSMWFHPLPTAVGTAAELISKRSYFASATDDFPFALNLNTTATSITALEDSGTDYSTDCTLVNTNLTPRVWHHVAVALQPSNTFYLWLDGIMMSTTVGVTTPCAGSRNFTFGRCSYENGGGTNLSYFKGYMTDIRLYGRVLTHAEVLAIVAGYSNTTGLCHWWACEEGTGTTLYNKYNSSYYNGTITNGEWSQFVPDIK